MGTRIIPGGCISISVSAESRMTEATFVFPTPQDFDDFGTLMARLASGIEVLIDVGDEDDD